MMQVQISTFMKKDWQKVFRVDKSIWGTKLGLKEWQYFYYAQVSGNERASGRAGGRSVSRSMSRCVRVQYVKSSV